MDRGKSNRWNFGRKPHTRGELSFAGTKSTVTNVVGWNTQLIIYIFLCHAT